MINEMKAGEQRPKENGIRKEVGALFGCNEPYTLGSMSLFTYGTRYNNRSNSQIDIALPVNCASHVTLVAYILPEPTHQLPENVKHQHYTFTVLIFIAPVVYFVVIFYGARAISRLID